MLTHQRTEEAHRLHGMWQKAGSQLSAVASDMGGVSGRDMLEALVDATVDAAMLAELARGRLRSKLPPREKALRGSFRPPHAILGREMLAHIEYLEQTLERVTARREEEMLPLAASVRRRKTIPGWGDHTAPTVLAEMGVDRSVFATDGHIARWSGLCPGNRRSGGKRQREPIRKGHRGLRAALVQAAWAAVRENRSYLSAPYHRRAAHKGKQKALVAVAPSMLVMAYPLLRDQVDYRDLGPDFFLKRNREAVQRRCLRQLKGLGYAVTLTPQKAA